MAILPLRFIAQQLAKTAAAEGARRVFGPDLEDVQNRAFDRFGRAIEDLTGAEVEELVADLPEEQARRIHRQNQQQRRIMTDFNTFMSIGLNQCGSDRRTFGQLVEVWNREKDDIENMTPAEVRSSLNCP